MLGTKEAVLVRVMQRGVGLPVSSIVDAVDDYSPGFFRGHTAMIVEGYAK
jgi:hypothetical protein